jgi:multiple sugar transport system ATP-binding protein
MDEPLSNLDAKLRVQARAEIADLHRRIGGTFVYVTHDQVEAMTMADRVAVMMGGELLQVAAPRDIYADPADIRVAEFIGAPKINIFPGRIGRSGRVEAFGQVLPLVAELPEGAVVSIGIRPEHVRIASQEGLPATVRHIEHLGSDTYVYLEIEGMAERVVMRQSPESTRSIQFDERLKLDIVTPRVFLFDKAGHRVAATGAASAPLQMAG